MATWSHVVMLKVQTITVSGSQMCGAALQDDGEVESDGDKDYGENVGPGLIPGVTAEARLEGVT